MKIAAEICIYTNENLIVETLLMEIPVYSPREIVSELDRSSLARTTPSARSRLHCATVGAGQVEPGLREEICRKTF